MSGAQRPPSFLRGAIAVAGLAVVSVLGWLIRNRSPVLRMAASVGNSLTLVAQGMPGGSTPRGVQGAHGGDTAPGEHREDGPELRPSVLPYLIGLGLAALLTAGSFYLSCTGSVYGPGVPVALTVFAVAQIGVHLVFFLHLTTAPDNINNVMALAFGTLIVLLLFGGTLWIMMHMNGNMMPTGSMPRMGRA